MDLIGFGTLIDHQHEAAAASQEVWPINDLLEQRRVAGCGGQVGIVERAAQAARHAFRLRGMGQAQGGEFGGNLGEDWCLGGEDAGDEQGETTAGRLGQVLGGGGGAHALEDFLKDGALGWHRSTSSARCGSLRHLWQEVFHARPG